VKIEIVLFSVGLNVKWLVSVTKRNGIARWWNFCKLDPNLSCFGRQRMYTKLAVAGMPSEGKWIQINTPGPAYSGPVFSTRNEQMTKCKFDRRLFGVQYAERAGKSSSRMLLLLLLKKVTAVLCQSPSQCTPLSALSSPLPRQRHHIGQFQRRLVTILGPVRRLQSLKSSPRDQVQPQPTAKVGADC